MMDIGDVKKVIDNVAQKPFLCSDTKIETQNEYIITTKAHYEELLIAKEDGLWECPVCGATDQHGHNYCDQCGQRLGWEDQI